MRWFIVREHYGAEESLLLDGWEPFAVAEEHDWVSVIGKGHPTSTTWVYLRKGVELEVPK